MLPKNQKIKWQHNNSSDPPIHKVALDTKRDNNIPRGWQYHNSCPDTLFSSFFHRIYFKKTKTEGWGWYCDPYTFTDSPTAVVAKKSLYMIMISEKFFKHSTSNHHLGHLRSCKVGGSLSKSYRSLFLFPWHHVPSENCRKSSKVWVDGRCTHIGDFWLWDVQTFWNLGASALYHLIDSANWQKFYL